MQTVYTGGGPNRWGKRRERGVIHLISAESLIHCMTYTKPWVSIAFRSFLSKSILRPKYTTWDVIFWLNLCLLSEELSKHGTFHTMLKTAQKYWTWVICQLWVLQNIKCVIILVHKFYIYGCQQFLKVTTVCMGLVITFIFLRITWIFKD